MNKFLEEIVIPIAVSAAVLGAWHMANKKANEAYPNMIREMTGVVYTSNSQELLKMYQCPINYNPFPKK